MKKINADKAQFLDEMIDYWKTEDLIDEQTADNLQKSFIPKSFDWKRLAKYSFWIALACCFISLSALLLDEKLLKYLKKLYDTPDIVISLLSAIVAAIAYYFGFKFKQAKPQNIFSNEALILTGVILTANAVAYLGKSLDKQSGHFSLLILFALLLYLLLAYQFKSVLIWLFSMLVAGIWFGTETAYLSNYGGHFMGLGYPLRYVIFGAIIIFISRLIKNSKISLFYEVTYFSGLLYFFMALLFLSIFGNYDSFEEWHRIRQYSLFYWAILSAGLCLSAILYGLKYNDKMAREFGLIFLFINLYIRYFEYFWDNMHKAIFFLILGLSFVFIGRKAEKIWNLEFIKKK